ncbi:DUF1634 domain-containing protein [Mucilaginibacter sp. 10I4]|uniref:DUF1634 domain-containing protein n=1 Tax=Mucilaginibacter sp. 10I4 TaxID=3048580 RepID=UPI002B23DA85|nr:DUF1634 domain-containing protein [Mucilaginibacter sp. 10I4]MEB0260703.1 DUF1634 domain-containing protein [Mucilaginibacter sp. 10I4]
MIKNQDKDIESQMGTLLRTGVIISAIIVFIGGVLYLFQKGQELPHYKKFTGEPHELINLRSIFINAFHFKSLAILQIGVLVLLATPVARVIFSIYGFIEEEDKMYIIVTLIVLGIIAFSLFSGIAG